MEFNIWWVFPVFVISILFVLLVIPAIVKTAGRMNLYDSSDDRKVHIGNVPRLGGITFLPGIIMSLLLFISVMSIDESVIMSLKGSSVIECMMVGAGCVVLYLTGILDDLFNVSYKTKFVMQIIASCLMCASGLLITDLHGLFGIHHLNTVVSFLLTMVIIVLIINSINLIDGIDGLASGLCIMGVLGYSYMFHLHGMDVFVLLASSMLGVLAMFYIFNTKGKSGVTKIFMGDTGSLTMGYLLAFLAIKLCCVEYSGSLIPEGVNMVYAASLILVPVMDVFRVFFSRIRHGLSPFRPDKRHIHHKFMAIGLSMKMTRLVIFALSICFFALNMILYGIMGWNINLVILFCAVLWLVMNILITRKMVRLVLAGDETALRYAELGQGLPVTIKRRN